MNGKGFLLALTGLFVLAASTPATEKKDGQTDDDQLILPYKQNYFLLSEHRISPQNRKMEEVKFQFSAKKLLLDTECGEEVYFAFTQKAFWQIFDNDPDDGNDFDSGQFREFNFNAEIFLVLFAKSSFRIQTSFLDHESNGASEKTSRSVWRNYLQAYYDFGNFRSSAKYWERNRGLEGDKDENPELENVLGNWEANLRYQKVDGGIELMAREKQDELTGQIDINVAVNLIPFLKKVVKPGIYLHFQYFSGFGESLIDFDQRVNRVGVGISFGDDLTRQRHKDKQAENDCQCADRTSPDAGVRR